VQREVERMEGFGLLLRSSEGNRVFYRLNAGFPLLRELTALFERESGGPGGAGVETSSVKREASEERQPFPWLESPPQPPLPPALRHVQVAGEWDRGY